MDRLLPKTITNNSPKAQKSGGQSRICCQRVEDNALHRAKTAEVHRIVYKNYHRALATRFPFALYYSVSEQTAFYTRDRRLPPRPNLDQRTSAISWQLASAYLHICAPLSTIWTARAGRFAFSKTSPPTRGNRPQPEPNLAHREIGVLVGTETHELEFQTPNAQHSIRHTRAGRSTLSYNPPKKAMTALASSTDAAYFGASEATIFSKHGSPRSGSQNGRSFNWP